MQLGEIVRMQPLAGSPSVHASILGRLARVEQVHADGTITIRGCNGNWGACAIDPREVVPDGSDDED